jgi:superfamily I DNA and/or RNA helicase
LDSSKAFLEKLLLKLKTGSSRSIHLNALPSRFARLDLYELINIEQSLHLKFIQQLLQKPTLKFQIQVDFKVIQKKSAEELKSAQQLVKTLDSIYYQQQDEFLEHGTKTFAFGFPLLIKRDPKQPTKILKAPLLIWYLDIEKDLHRINSWTLHRNEEHPVIFNELLRTHIEANDGIKMDDLLEALEDAPINEAAILQLCKSILQKLGTESSTFDDELKVLPSTNAASIEKLTQQDPWIRWSGIFGLYKTQKQSIIQDIETMIAQFPEVPQYKPPTFFKNENTSILSALPLDPSQEAILQKTTTHNKIIIQGPPGTGKSQSLTAIITNALYQGKTCLVVCEKKTAMDIIFQKLAEKHLDELCILIDDVNADRKQVVDKVRNSLETRGLLDETFEHYHFEESRQKFEHSKNEVNQQLKHLNHKCFGDYNLINLIARLQKDKETLAYADLKKDIEEIFDSYSYEDFKTIESVLNEAFSLYEILPKAALALKSVDDIHFLQKVAPNPYSDWKLMKEQVGRILDILRLELNDDGAIFNERTKLNEIKISIGALFSSKMKRIKAARKLILSEWNILTEHFNEKKYFQHSFSDIQLIPLFSSIKPNIQSLHLKLDQLISEEIYYQPYYKWRQFILSQPENIQILLTYLSEEVNRNEWQNSFKIYYYSTFIEQYKSKYQLSETLENTLNEVETQTNHLQESLSGKINTIWKERQQYVLNQRTLATIKNLYNYRRNKAFGKINSLRKIIHQDFEIFSTTFPVVMVNPSVCSSIFPLAKDLFDLILFDEASQLRIEDTYPALLRGKTKIISGDKHQMPPSSYFSTQVALFGEEELLENDEIGDEHLAASGSLLDYCMDSDFSATYLDFHYRSQHPALIQFSNEAFYGGRLVPMPTSKPYLPIRYFQVNGVYDAGRTNLMEANALVDYVYSNFKTTEISVGIATFNMNQRNLIWDLLMQRTYDNPLHSSQLEQLISSGLFVKNLENIQGDERDVILISTTFGPDEKGNFRQQFGPITQQKGYQLLNVIITRAKQNLVIFTSIPEINSAQFSNEITEKGNSGKGIFYSYLHYAKAVAEAHEDKRKNVLALVNNYCIEGNYKHEHKNMTLFHQMIYTALVDVFGQNAIQHNYTFGGFVLELCLLRNEVPVVAISTDYLLQTDSTAYKMMQYKRGILKHYGIKTYSIQTLKWFDNWEVEMGRLIGELKNS